MPPAAERVYAHVKRAILSRRYAGGSLLTEGGLADEVGVSRTPVREALLRLEMEGLLKLYPKKGALVLPVSAQEIADVMQARRLVEQFAVRAAIPAPVQLLDQLEELVAEQKAAEAAGNGEGFAQADRAFHRAIVVAAGNVIIENWYDQLRDRQLRMGVEFARSTTDRVRRSIDDHEAILHALRSGEAVGAAELAGTHIDRIERELRGERE
ncbi:GntR family transcriptional regulator [Mangrovactinospora gilvigrisea]|uniref:GntR family transcriptional regulator n=1 Tax=Mangrovactinospora gilvigrisea TaxID=1428644 RepID=A0A1J7BHZ6_9ACTN|nr:GntR family transcriptional regulator [Mangrovactinospora gilvigrisea]OIV38205.1 GntR family transcriptional regulator [Mangrovactinospora gilvigrisea]